MLGSTNTAANHLGAEGGGGDDVEAMGAAEAMDVDAIGGSDIEHKQEQPTTCSIECFKGGNLTRLKIYPYQAKDVVILYKANQATKQTLMKTRLRTIAQPNKP
jgi:hypothetical protein